MKRNSVSSIGERVFAFYFFAGIFVCRGISVRVKLEET